MDLMRPRHFSPPRKVSSRWQYCKASERNIVHPTYLQPPARTCIASSLDLWHSRFQCFQSTFAHPNQWLHLWTLRLAQCRGYKFCSLFGLAILEKSVTPIYCFSLSCRWYILYITSCCLFTRHLAASRSHSATAHYFEIFFNEVLILATWKFCSRTVVVSLAKSFLSLLLSCIVLDM